MGFDPVVGKECSGEDDSGGFAGFAGDEFEGREEVEEPNFRVEGGNDAVTEEARGDSDVPGLARGIEEAIDQFAILLALRWQ